MWNIDDFICDVDVLNKMLKNADSVEKYKILRAIGQVNANIIAINFDDNNLTPSKFGVDEAFSNYVDEYNDYVYYIDLINSFYNSLKVSKFIDFIDDNKINQKLTFNEYFDSVLEFYSSIGGIYYKTFLNLYKNNKIIFKYYEDEDESKDYNGITYFTPYLNKAYIEYCYSSNNPRCGQLLTGIHECAHGICAAINNDRYMSDIYINEIESIFFELVACDFYSAYFNNNSFYNESYSKLIDYYYDFAGLKELNKYIDKYIKLSYKKEVISNLSKKDKKIFNYYSNSLSLKTEYKYLTSFIVATNLYLIYKENEKDGLKMLSKIIKCSKQSEYQTINNCIGDKSYVLKYKKNLESKISCK